MQREYPLMQDKLSPRPSPQHSKSLTAPSDCTNCFKQQSNPINNFISKWKYKEDLARPINTKRTRPRKQPQTTYHFPLSHCSVNTFNPNNKSNNESTNKSPSPDNSEDSSPMESPVHSPRDIHELSPRSPVQSPVVKQSRTHGAQQGYYEEEEDEHSGDYHSRITSQRREHETTTLTSSTTNGHPHDTHMSSPPTSPYKASYVQHHHHLATPTHISPRYNHHGATDISAICNPKPAHDPTRSPISSDNDGDQSPYEANCSLRHSRKRRSSLISEDHSLSDTIEISDSDSDYLSPLSPPLPSNSLFSPPLSSYQSPPHSPRLSRRSPPPSLVAPARGNHPSFARDRHHHHHHHHLSLTASHTDLAKYHLQGSRASCPPSLPPLDFGRLPSISELHSPWPRDDSVSHHHFQQHHYRSDSSIRHHPRSHSFPSC